MNCKREGESGSKVLGDLKRATLDRQTADRRWTKACTPSGTTCFAVGSALSKPSGWPCEMPNARCWGRSAGIGRE
jgi:hypothetical protein